jgi:hypothetical protein
MSVESDPEPDPIEMDSNEPNDSFAEATPMSGWGGGGGTVHVFGQRLDVDYFQFTAPSSTTVSVRLNFIHNSGNLALTMYDGNRNQIAASNTSTPSKNYERVTLPVQGGQTYYVKVGGAKSPDYSFAVSPLTANFDWSMPKRFGSVDQFGLPVAPNTRDYVVPNPVWINGVETARFPVQFNVPGGPTGGDITYNYNIVGANYSDNFTAGGATVQTHLPNGNYTVTLTTSADGHSVSTQQNITVRNFLVAAIGDSYASGEGNPHSPAQYDWLGFATRGAVWAQGGDDLESLRNRMAHRSTQAGVAQMALELENADAKTSVTFVFLPHTGATVLDGVLNPRNSSDPGAPGTNPAQLDRLQELTSGRRIDSLFMSVGGNDLGFGDILADLVKNDPVIPGGNYEGTISLIIERALNNLDDLRDNRYPELAQRLSSFNIGQIFLTEYPDLTKQSDGNIAAAIIDDIVGGLEVDRHELTRLIEEVMPQFIGVMKTSAAKFGWNYVDGVLQAFSHHGYGDWFRKASDSVVLQGPLGNRNTVTPFDMEKTLGTMHPINGGLAAQRDAILNDVRKANLVIDAFSIGGSAQSNSGGTYSITVTNNSFLATAGASTAGIYLSGDTSIDTNDTQLLTFNVPALAPGQTITLTGTLPSMADPYRTAGNKVFIAPVLDINHNVDESDEVDNRVFSANKMGILQSEMDLQPSGEGWIISPRSMNLGDTLAGKLGIDEIVGRGDVDVFAFNATAGQTIDIDLDVAGFLDTYIRVYDTWFGWPVGNPVASNDNAFAPGETLNTGDSYVRFTPQLSGRFFVVVSHVANRNADPANVTGRVDGGTGEYSINVKAINAAPPVAQSFNYNVETNQIVAQFSQDVGASVASSVLQVVNTTTGQTIPSGWFTTTWNAAQKVATFTFNVPMTNGNYRATLVGDQIRNGDGTPMASSPSHTFHVLAGDVNRDRKVDFSDLLILAQNYGKSGRTYATGNLDRSGNGSVDFNDLLILAQNYGQTLPVVAALLAGDASEDDGAAICGLPIGAQSPAPRSSVFVSRKTIDAELTDEPI